MADYSEMTDEEFDNILLKVVSDAGGLQAIMSIPDVNGILREEYNNEVLTAWEGENPEKAFGKTVEIIQHQVKFYYADYDIEELPESEEEHIHNMIINGNREGELLYGDPENDDIEYRGWWKIIK